MNRFFKILSLAVVLALMMVLGSQVVQALRDAAAPPALPYGLSLQDTMRSVEHKLGYPRVDHALQAGRELGLPDEGGSPDHIHYWAVYRRFGFTVIYDSPSPNDKNAVIIAIRYHDGR